MEDLTGQVDTVDSISAAEWNNLRQELKNYITDQGLVMSVGDLFQMQRAVAHHSYRMPFLLTAGGSANAHTAAASATVKGPRALVNGLTVTFRPVAINTSATPTLNVQTLGAIVVKKEDGGVLVAGDLTTARDAQLRFDGTNWLLSESSLGAPSQALPIRYRTGMTLGRNAADLDHDIVVTVGSRRDVANGANMNLSSALVKRFDADIAEGSGVGGYAGGLGARVADTWYRVFAVANADGVVEVGWDSLANDAAEQLIIDLNVIRAGWAPYRQIGWGKTTAVATTLRRLIHVDEDPTLFRLEDCGGYFVDNITAPLVQTALAVDDAPPLSVAELEIRLENDTGGGNDELYGFVIDKESGDPVPTRASHNAGMNSRSSIGEDKFSNLINVKVDAASEIFHRWAITTGAANELYMRVMSFRWEG